MFGFLKDKLKQAIGSFSKSAEKDIKEETVETPKEKTTPPPKKEKDVKKDTKETPKKPEPKHEEKKTVEKKVEEKKAEAPKKEVLKEETKKTEEKKPEHKPEAKKAEERKPEPKHEEKKTAEKPAEEKRHEIKTHETKQTEKQPDTHKKETPKEELKKTEDKKPEEKKPEPKHEEKKAAEKPVEKKTEEKKAEEKKSEEPKSEKKGFFAKIFGKKKEETPKEKPEEKAPVKKIEEEKEVISKEKEILEPEEEQEETIEEETQDEEETEEEAQEEEPEAEEEPEQKKGFFGKLTEAFTKKTLTPEKFDELFWDLEVAMLENNVAVEVIEKIKSDLKDELTTGKVSRAGLEDAIKDRLRKSIEELFDVEQFDLIDKIKKSQKPFKICIIGVNGSGKTTTLAKIIHLLQQNNLSVVVAASDTFRAAAIDQLKEHTEKLNVKLISHGYNADPAAVAFDAIEHAKAKGVDVVLIDTAGRLHSNTNLMQELEKVVRVNKPDLKLFVGEAITGNDCVEQATVFNKLVGIDAMILSKADVDEKGGASISVSYVTGKPILYFGVGQRYEDLVRFDKEKIIESLDL